MPRLAPVRATTRLGLTDAADPDRVEAQIRALIPERHQSDLSAVVNYHGRRCCSARRPACERCVVAHLCPYFQQRAPG